jgi:phosphoserine phosphatase RsbU/P
MDSLILRISIATSILFAMLFLGTFIYNLSYRRRNKMRKRIVIQEKDAILGFIHNVGEVFADSETIEMDSLLTRVLHYAVRTCRAGSGAIYLLNPKSGLLTARAISGVFPPPCPIQQKSPLPLQNATNELKRLVESHPIQIGQGLIGESAVLGNAIRIADAEMDARVPNHADPFLKIKTMLIAPMRFGSHTIGVMCLINRTNDTAFSAADLSLAQALAAQAAVPVHYAGLQEALEQKRQFDRDMQIAQQIQTSLLPKQLPAYPGIELAAFNHPALEIGGDYYDVVDVDEKHIGLTIADVSGKGVGGALMMAVCRSVLRANAVGIYDPARMLCTLNSTLSQNLAEDMFISMLYMILNLETLELKIARAGHEAPILTQPGAEPRLIESAGIAIGLADCELFAQTIASHTIQLKQGDTIITYTDGITEAMDSDGNEWGIDQLMLELKQLTDASANTMLDTIQDQVCRFSSGGRQYDDMTMLALKII